MAGLPPSSDHANQGSASGGGGSDLIPSGGSSALTTSAAKVVITYDLVDSTAPAITIASPGDGATYDQGQGVQADYSCSDDGLGASGVESCDGPVPSGSPIDTSTLGDHAFTVSASDNAGNTSSETVHYTVVARQGSSGGSGPSATPSVVATAPSVLLPAGRVTISHRFLVRLLGGGRERVRLVCPASAPKGCFGTIALVSRFGRAPSRSYGLGAGRARVYSVQPGAALVRYLERHPKHKPLRAIVVATNTTAGAAAQTSSRQVHVAGAR
jgi:hypothetical protein